MPLRAKSRLPLIGVICWLLVWIGLPPDLLSEDFEVIVAAVQHEREELKSGVFHGQGLVVDGGKAYEWNMYCAFDFPRERFRVEQFTPQPLRTSSGITKAGFVRTSDLRLQYGMGGALEGSVCIFGSGQEIPDMLSHELKPFDVRTLGWAIPSAIDKGTSLDEMCRVLKGYPVQASIHEDDEGIVRLVWSTTEPGPTYRQTLWINISEGYAPIRHEMGWVSDDRAAIPLDATCLATWQLHSDVYVPVSFTSEAAGRKYEMAIEWESVNQPVDERLFTKEHLGLDPNTVVIDYRLGEPVMVGTLERAFDTPTPRRWVWLWMGLGAVALIASVWGAFKYQKASG